MSDISKVCEYGIKVRLLQSEVIGRNSDSSASVAAPIIPGIIAKCRRNDLEALPDAFMIWLPILVALFLVVPLLPG